MSAFGEIQGELSVPAQMQGELQPMVYRFKFGGFEIAEIFGYSDRTVFSKREREKLGYDILGRIWGSTCRFPPLQSVSNKLFSTGGRHEHEGPDCTPGCAGKRIGGGTPTSLSPWGM